MARRVTRPMALYLTWLAVRAPVSANQITLLALIAGCLAAAAVATGTWQGLVSAAVLLQLWYLLDHVDGQVARYHGAASLGGAFFDYVMHYVVHFALGVALGYGQFARTGRPIWFLAGAALAAGMALLLVQHDCRYKAFFRRLKREDGLFLVEGGSGARPEAPQRPPRRALPLGWYAVQKLCEIHVMMNVIGAVAVVAVGWPRTAVEISAWLTAAWAVAVPVVAAVKIARAIRTGDVDREFAAWFRPLGE